jgi:tetratricopeptide (TPR) repeat protein
MRSFRFNRLTRTAVTAAATVLLVSGCDFLDPTDVTNPNTTTEDLANAASPTTALLPGVRAQMARAVRAVVQTNALVSDDFEIAFTNVGPELSDPYQLSPDGPSYNSTGAIGAYWNTQELRALADFVIDTIAPNDETATNEQLAEAHYYRGMAYLLQGENFVAAATLPDQAPTPWDQLLALAEQDFTAALAIAGGASLPSGADLGLALNAALARTHRAAGNVTEARTFAEAALGADTEFVVHQVYAAGEIENPFSTESRTYQPLPRLDFLDPKYTERGSPIAVSKAEEMYLILAEIEMVAGNYNNLVDRGLGDFTDGAGYLAEAIRVAGTRPVVAFDDDDARLNPNLTDRPSSSDMLVASGPGEDLRAGLVLDRPGVVDVPTISGTSLDADSVEALTDPEDIRHAFWLARQEILFLEGRRVHDLGVRMPVMQREIDTNPTISDGDAVTQASVPTYIPDGTMDDFSPREPYVVGTNEIVIAVDMNRILAQERVSPLGPLAP